MENKKVVVLDGSPPLPEEIICLEIFTRLPLKSVYRFRCVSKSHRLLTSDPRFLDAFRRHSRGGYVLSFTTASGKPRIFYLSTHGGDVEELQNRMVDNYRENYIKVTKFREIRNYIKFINGFTCLALERETVIRNFATGQQFLLPRFQGYCLQWDDHFVYFCYDPATDKYKVLRTTRVRNSHLDVVDMKFSIFTLGTDKTWRHFRKDGLYQLWYSKSSNVCIDGVLFCTNFSTSKNSKDGIIAAFDVGGERFDSVAWPDGLSRSSYSECDLINVKGSIAIIAVQDRIIRLWIKGEAEGFGFDSWIEHRIQFPLPLEDICFLSCKFSFAANRNGEIVIGIAMTSIHECRVFVHNIETGNWSRIDEVVMKGCNICRDFVIDEYVENPCFC